MTPTAVIAAGSVNVEFGASKIMKSPVAVATVAMAEA
jgi:hypothetical protein